MRIETTAAQAGHQIDAQTGAVAPPIHVSTTFERDADGEYSRGYTYSRRGNPTRGGLEAVLAELEGGSCAAAFSSGSAASAAVFQALSAGDHIIAPEDCYHPDTSGPCSATSSPAGAWRRPLPMSPTPSA